MGITALLDCRFITSILFYILNGAVAKLLLASVPDFRDELCKVFISQVLFTAKESERCFMNKLNMLKVAINKKSTLKVMIKIRSIQMIKVYFSYLIDQDKI